MQYAVGIVELYNRLPERFSFCWDNKWFSIPAHDSLVMTVDMAVAAIHQAVYELDDNGEPRYYVVPHTRKDLWEPILEKPKDPLQTAGIQLDPSQPDKWGRQGDYVVIPVPQDPSMRPNKRARKDQTMDFVTGEG